MIRPEIKPIAGAQIRPKGNRLFEPMSFNPPKNMKSTEQQDQQQFIELVRAMMKQRVTGKDDRNSKNKISSSKLGQAVNYSGAALSLFKTGTYTGDNYAIAKVVFDFFQRLDEKQASQNKELNEIVETKAVKKVVQACRISHIESTLIVITGDAGVGKTKGVAKYVAENTGVVHVQIIPYYSAKNVINKIASEVGVDNTGSVIVVFERVLNKLKGSGKLLLIDEAELLPYRALELIRRIYDLAEIGVVLVGMPKLIANLKGYKSEYKQLYSRVSMHVQISDLQHDDPKLAETKEEQERMQKAVRDIEKLVKARLPKSNGIWKEFAKYTLNPRTLDNLIRQSIKVAQHNDAPLNAETIEEAQKLIIF